MALVFATVIYLIPFIDRGWMPHDEGTLGGNALRVLAGEVPHIDFQDYPGAMTWLYAALFRMFGVDVIYFRYALFVGALVAVLVWYFIARRFADPVAAASTAAVALLWSFPNYFAGLPSWWNVIFGSCGALFLIRFAETGRLVSLLIAGMFCGLACTFKQTGIYLVATAALSALYAEQARMPAKLQARVHPSAVLRALVAALATACIVILLASRMSPSTLILLALPPVAISVVLFLDEWHRRDPQDATRLRAVSRSILVLSVGVLLPIAVWLVPYARRGAWQPLSEGTLGLARNVARVVVYEAPSAWLAIGLPLLLLILRLAAALDRGRPRTALVWTVPALVTLFFPLRLGHLLMWNAFRFGASVTVVASAYLIWHRRSLSTPHNSSLYIIAATTAFFGLNQYPFSAPVYFCYVAPFAVLTLLGALTIAGEPARSFRAPLLVALAIFAAMSLNRGYLDNMGYEHAVVQFDTNLDLPRASLRVSSADAHMYRRVVALIEAHGRGDTIYAFPDCPEIYYLASKRNPSPANFDIFHPLATDQVLQIWAQRNVQLVVINLRPRFSGPPPIALLQAARSRFQHFERVGLFEVRWRE